MAVRFHVAYKQQPDQSLGSAGMWAEVLPSTDHGKGHPSSPAPFGHPEGPKPRPTICF